RPSGFSLKTERSVQKNQSCCSIPAAHSSTSMCSVAERHTQRLSRNEQIEIHGHGLHLAHHFGKRFRDNVWRIERHHSAKFALAHEVDRFYFVARRKDAIEAGGGPASLQVAEHDRSRFLAGQ